MSWLRFVGGAIFSTSFLGSQISDGDLEDSMRARSSIVFDRLPPLTSFDSDGSDLRL